MVKIFKERRTVTPKISMISGEPIVYIDPLAIEKMLYYVRHCDKEIGWLGTAERYDNEFLIKDVYLFHQEVNGATCEINPNSLADFVTDLLTKDVEHGMEIANSLKVWGHSHVSMGVSPSGQDEKQVRDFADGNEWFLRIIANKAGELEIGVFDFKNGVVYADVKWMIYYPAILGLEAEIIAEMKDKVVEKKYTNITGSHTSSRNTYAWADSDDYDVEGYEWDADLRAYVPVGTKDKKKATVKEVKGEKDNGVDVTPFVRNADGSVNTRFIIELIKAELDGIVLLNYAYQFKEYILAEYQIALTWDEASEVFDKIKLYEKEKRLTTAKENLEKL